MGLLEEKSRKQNYTCLSIVRQKLYEIVDVFEPKSKIKYLNKGAWQIDINVLMINKHMTMS